MERRSIILRLERNADVFAALAGGVGPEQARWRPSPEAWSVLDVVCHLVDEESRDFRTRVDLTRRRARFALRICSQLGLPTT